MSCSDGKLPPLPATLVPLCESTNCHYLAVCLLVVLKGRCELPLILADLMRTK